MVQDHTVQGERASRTPALFRLPPSRSSLSHLESLRIGPRGPRVRCPFRTARLVFTSAPSTVHENIKRGSFPGRAGLRSILRA